MFRLMLNFYMECISFDRLYRYQGDWEGAKLGARNVTTLLPTGNDIPVSMTYLMLRQSDIVQYGVVDPLICNQV